MSTTPPTIPDTTTISEDCYAGRHAWAMTENVCMECGARRIANEQIAHSIDLRDWFAGMAMQRLVYFDGAAELLGAVAKQAYAVADAMMKARGT